MGEVIVEKEIEEIVEHIFADYEGQKNIDSIDIYNKPDKAEVRDLVNKLSQIVFPGYFRDKSYKIYNRKNSFAVLIEDIFYHLNKQVYLALDFCKMRGQLSDEERRKESYRICKAFFHELPKVREYVETDLEAGVKRHPTIEDHVTIYSGASVLGGETVIGKNAVIGGNAFITSSIPADTRVSIKNQELEYRTGGNTHKTEELQQSDEWYYII